MSNLNEIFAKNLIKLRKQKKLTQLELANTLNYSDRNISKWENALALPSTEVMKEISDYFGVTIDYLLKEHTEEELPSNNNEYKLKTSYRNKLIVFALSIVCVYLIATILFISFPHKWKFSWLSFIWAIPVSSIVSIVFISLWFKKYPFLFLAISLLVWSIFLSIYLTVLMLTDINIWFIFLVGCPLQIATLLWSQFLNPSRK